MTADRPVPLFTLTRHYDRPLTAVWRAWTDREALHHWWGPKGCEIDILRFECRPGGLFHYSMQFDGAPLSWGRFFYRDIEPRTRIEWLNAFANQDGGIVRAPFSDDCPLEIVNAVSFSEHDGQTTITLRAAPFGAADNENRYFDELQPSLEEGYGGTFDQLADWLRR